MATKRKKKTTPVPDPLEPGNIPGQNPATPERMPGHTRFYAEETEEGGETKDAGEAERELTEALEHTFPASDPVSAESTLVPGSRRRR